MQPAATIERLGSARRLLAQRSAALGKVFRDGGIGLDWVCAAHRRALD
jgi:hypothetical protein